MPTPANTASSLLKEQRLNALYACLAAVPQGVVMSYGDLAKAAGLGNAARWVGRCLSQLPDETQLPWHRSISASGRLSLPAHSPAGREQRQRLQAEGVNLENDRINMRRHRWQAGTAPE